VFLVGPKSKKRQGREETAGEGKKEKGVQRKGRVKAFTLLSSYVTNVNPRPNLCPKVTGGEAK